VWSEWSFKYFPSIFPNLKKAHHYAYAIHISSFINHTMLATYQKAMHEVISTQK